MKLLGRKESKQRLDQVLLGKEPPTLPQAVMKLLRLLRDPESDTSEITEALRWDPGLVVRILQLVNSAALGMASKIDCVQHAVTMIGRSQLEQLVLGVAVKDCLPRISTPGFDGGRFWRTAFFRAALANALAEELHPADQTRSFTGALLQDMAIPLLAHARPDDYGRVLEEWHRSPTAQLDVLEKETFGWCHAEIGGFLGVEWELPTSLTQVILLHHTEEATDRELPAALRLVAILRETQRQHGLDALVEEGRQMYGLDPDWILGTVQECDERALELSKSLS